MTTITIDPPKLHTSQARVASHPARFRVMACGRRWGKTRLGSLLCIDTAIKGGRAWWVAPSYRVAEVGWRLVSRLAKQIPGAEIKLNTRTVFLPNGGEVSVRSADNPDSLRGEGLDFLVMDECAYIKEAAWYEALRPALSDRLGRAVFISTPHGRNWFWRIYQQGIDPHNAEWQAWQLPTSDNPYIADSEIEAARRGMPERKFQQEYLAMFLDDAGGVFRGVREAATAVAQEPQEGRQYVIGVDVASQLDFTVVTVIDAETKAMVYLDRFNRVDYPMLESRIRATWERYNRATLIIESNSIGLPVIDHLRLSGLPVQSFTTTSATKANAIQALQAAFEHGTIAILDDEVLISELQAFEGVRLANGMKYAAPDGMHDDCVMSLAIAWSGVQQSGDLFVFGI